MFGRRSKKVTKEWFFIVHYALFTVHFYAAVQECRAAKAHWQHYCLAQKRIHITIF